MEHVAAILIAYAWPLVLLIVAFWFRPAGPSLIEGIRSLFTRGGGAWRGWKFSGWGVSVETPPLPQPQKRDDVPQNTLTAPNAGSLPTLLPGSPVAIIVEQDRAALAEIPEPERQEALLRALARARIQAGHEFIYNRIFGSQIEGLRRLNIIGSATIEQAREFFSPYAEAHPELYDKYTFDKWLEWMVSQKLIERENELISVSVFGRDFLQYLVEARLSSEKPF